MDNIISYGFSVGEISCAVVLDGASVIGAPRILKRFPNGTEAHTGPLTLRSGARSMKLIVL